MAGKSEAAKSGRAKIYEMRRYVIKPDKYTEFIRHAEEKRMMPHGKLLGYWATTLGALNEIYHLWEYESYAHRDEVRKAARADKKVMEEYLKFALTCFDSQNHTIMKAFDWYTPKLETPQKWGVYELVTHKIKPGMLPQMAQLTKEGLPARLKEDYPPPLAMWHTDFGNPSLMVSLWPHESFDKRDEHREQLFKNNAEWNETFCESMKLIDEIEVKGMVPLPWSPLQ